MRRSFGLGIGVVFGLGCGPGLAHDGSEGASETSAGDGDTDPGDGDGDGDTNPGDGDEPGDGDGDGDGDGSVCNDGEIACPDGTCQLDLGAPDPCCGHAGSCLQGCEAQDASATADSCDALLYAWTGINCTAICACEGADCGSLYSSVGACLEAHEPACGYIGLETCPFETPIGPTWVAGTTPFGPRSYAFGAFGPVYGEGSGINLAIVLGRDELTLGNHLWDVWNPPQTADTLKIWGANVTLGGYDVYVSVPIPLSQGATGQLVLTSIVTEAASYQDYELWATLDVSEGDWELHGEFAIPGCQKLEDHLP